MNNLIIKKSKIHGKGLFANKDFKEGEIVLKWNPTPLTEEETNNLTTKQEEYTISKNGKYYSMNSPEKYMNHSCEPNTKMNLNDFCDIAIKDIKKGEEITSYYSNKKGNEEACNCGSKNCNGKF
jgi:SET domain-containing protein